MLSILSTKSTLLCSAEWARKRDGADTIDTNNSRIDERAEAESPADVLGKDTSHETVFTIVSLFDNLLFRLKLVYNSNWSKNLVLVDKRCLVRVGKDGWFDKVALCWSSDHDQTPFISVHSPCRRAAVHRSTPFHPCSL